MKPTTTAQGRRSLDRTLFVVCLVALGLFVAYPTVRLLIEAFLGWSWDAVLKGVGRRALLNTLVMCFASVLTSGLLGTALAFFIWRYRFPGRTPLAALAYLPFALPPLVGTLSFYYLIGPDFGLIPGIVQRATPWDDFNVSGPLAILMIHTYSFSVYFYAMVSASLEGLDMAQIEAARSLGAGRWRTLRTIALPLLKPALVGAALLAFMTSGASFSAPLFFGNDFPYLSVQIYNESMQFNRAAALTLSVVLGAVSLLGVALFRSRRTSGAGASKGVPHVVKAGPARLLTGVLAWTFMLVLLAPHLNILFLSFADHRAWQEELFPTQFTLDNYIVIFRDASVFQPIRNSLWVSLLAALGTVLIGLPAAYLIGRGRKGNGLINVLVMIPWALPGTVVAMNLIAAFYDPWLPAYTAVMLLPIGYFVRFLPLWTRIVTASMTQFDASLIEAARSLGGSPGYCFRRIVAPLLAPSIAAATALVFASCLGEFVASILLYRPANLPISVRIYQEWRGSGLGAAFAYSVFLMLMVTGTFMLARRFASRTI